MIQIPLIIFRFGSGVRICLDNTEGLIKVAARAEILPRGFL